MDVLSDAITAMRTGRPHSALQRRRGPWSGEFPAADGAGFHIVLQGACRFHPREGEAVALGVGDAVFLPREPGHRLTAAPEAGPDAEAVLLCGSYQLDGARAHPLWEALPPHVHIRAKIGGPAPMRAAIELLGAELAAAAPGSDAVVPALLDTLLVHMLRHWIDTEPEAHGGWAAAMRDPAVLAALTALHEAPSDPWTVGSLARAAGMSRSGFAERFARMVGRPPMAYLTWWRMTTAAKLLREGDAPVAAVAKRTGYASEFAFAKAFKRELGLSPGRYRSSSAGEHGPARPPTAAPRPMDASPAPTA
ncbi:AraC family transcriptional regulator [Glycomyces sp. A-F 0318]|uniref:AraC family transcriptional regulator n=1 Tax=Glycomyces amatae TaxID=2881355 RepID=UPI001E52700D|nr:AraC family transcriptional regulator [Glycomyces amatae]MCD0445018.1 AraC family transcriptional regulator [Glycomyces amatae]